MFYGRNFSVNTLKCLINGHTSTTSLDSATSLFRLIRRPLAEDYKLMEADFRGIEGRFGQDILSKNLKNCFVNMKISHRPYFTPSELPVTAWFGSLLQKINSRKSVTKL